MPAHLLLRLSSQIMHMLFGSFAVFCLYYAATLSDHHAAMVLFLYAVENGAIASAIAYFQGKYPSNV